MHGWVGGRVSGNVGWQTQSEPWTSHMTWESPRTRVHTPSRVWEKRFPPLSSLSRRETTLIGLILVDKLFCAVERFSSMVAFLTDVRLVFRSSLVTSKPILTVVINFRVTFNNLRLLCQSFHSNFPFLSYLGILLFLEIVIFMIKWFNKTSCRPIRSVIILVIDKSDSRCAVVRLCYHWYDYRLNGTTEKGLGNDTQFM